MKANECRQKCTLSACTHQLFPLQPLLSATPWRVGILIIPPASTQMHTSSSNPHKTYTVYVLCGVICVVRFASVLHTLLVMYFISSVTVMHPGACLIHYFTYLQ
eukprot:COSAG02_NODE_1114_length_14502_cov_140.830035_5_plen_104_part_00